MPGQDVRLRGVWARVAGLMYWVVLIVDLVGMQLHSSIGRSLSLAGALFTVPFAEGDHLVLMHYCDFGNRPHMISVPSKDGKSIEFDTSEAPGSDQIGHVSQAVSTMIDSNHHSEDWIFLPAGQKPVHAHLDFKRVQAAPAQASR